MKFDAHSLLYARARYCNILSLFSFLGKQGVLYHSPVRFIYSQSLATQFSWVLQFSLGYQMTSANQDIVDYADGYHHMLAANSTSWVLQVDLLNGYSLHLIHLWLPQPAAHVACIIKSYGRDRGKVCGEDTGYTLVISLHQGVGSWQYKRNIVYAGGKAGSIWSLTTVAVRTCAII